ncbi:outer membrane beta-barrel protein [Roseibacillus ishigakijimensis]|uniref:Outer membrane beta-barrel protein n=1 Tax=Roseibacillus ishigakijimensis TaxID=454146 RepID=A0A934VJU4_9BACT|nr:outer membrane beta-barrel protein [Roseibacillus ishigakijimensis]MBK1832969.1 outer membrane beta-barrel protein [Roseibacillus ishigakijimensis]
MNKFTKSIFAGLLPCAAVSAQGLYSIAPNDDEASESLPLTYVVGASVGYDDNPTPYFSNGDEESFYVSAFAQANWTSVTPQTTWDIYARVGVRHYFENFDSNDADETNGDVRVGVNFTHRFSERLRFSSRNFLAFEQEPDYDYGFGNDRRVGDYFRYSSENSVGYRWTERLGTQTGVNFSGVTYSDIDDSDYTRVTFRHDFRYRVSPATVVTAGYRYGFTDSDGSGDTDSHYIVGGVEHRISPESGIVFRAGAQIVDPDNGDSHTKPFFEGTLRTRLTSQLSSQVFVRYSSENWNRSFSDGDGIRHSFEESQTLRIGAKATYALSPQVSLFGGVNYILTDYEDIIRGTGEGDEGLLNLNAGVSYQMTDNLYLTGSYNFTDAYSDFEGREYDRNRFQLGVQATF